MKKLCCLISLAGLIHIQSVSAQPVPRVTVVEHFTNTFCSVCASRNPGFYSNLASFPQVLHLSYYPSAPYSACPFNQMNKPEQDARTNFYGVYGSTPRLVVNGSPISASTLYTDPSIFQAGLNETSDFSLNIQVRRTAAAMGEATITVKKVAANTLNTLQLYAVVAEDTVHFNANNGETVHYDKFNKSLTGTSPITFAAPAAIGDSINSTFSFAIGSGWSRSCITAILQDGANNGLQAARSAAILSAASVPATCALSLCMFPIPVKNELHFTALPAGYHRYVISNALGQTVQRGVVYDVSNPIMLRSLENGFYIITVDEGRQIQRGTFVKQ